MCLMHASRLRKEVFSLKEARALLIMGAFFYVGLNIWQFNASIFLKDVFMWGPTFIGGIFVWTLYIHKVENKRTLRFSMIVSR
jgi:hypothetical protein